MTLIRKIAALLGRQEESDQEEAVEFFTALYERERERRPRKSRG
jgi:hypothetical protein